MLRLLVGAFLLGSASLAMAGERVEYRPTADTMALLLQDERAIFVAVEQRTLARVAELHDFDALSLLLKDESATYVRGLPPFVATPALRGFDMRDPVAIAMASMPNRVDLDGFDSLSAATPTYVGSTQRQAVTQLPFAVSYDVDVRPPWVVLPVRNDVTSNSGGRYAVKEAMRAGRRDYRPGALDAMLHLGLDGREETPAFSVLGGIAGAVWTVVPKN